MPTLYKLAPLFKPADLTIEQFSKINNRIAIIRNIGGLGDIFMHRMMFEDFKQIAPDCEITFALPQEYHIAVEDHPYIDRVVDCKTLNKDDYGITYNTSNACIRYEVKIAPFADKHRSDIWANHCGVELKNHEMHIRLTDEEVATGKELIEKHRTRSGPSVAFCPISAMPTKNLNLLQQTTVINCLHDHNCFAFGLHTDPIDALNTLKIPTIHRTGIKKWMCVLAAADYVVSTDTAAFHFAGGIKKPLTGIFSFADGKIYGKYFDFILVQKHRDDGDWDCGPCYNYGICSKCSGPVKPCLTEITSKMLKEGIEKMFLKWTK